MKNALALCGKGWLGAALGVAVYMLITSIIHPHSPGMAQPSIDGLVIVLLMAMLFLGGTFGVISALVHSFCKPSIISCLLIGCASVVIIGGYIVAVNGTHGFTAALADGVIIPFVALIGLAALMGSGGYAVTRVLS